jgi:hypothetical protein
MKYLKYSIFVFILGMITWAPKSMAFNPMIDIPPSCIAGTVGMYGPNTCQVYDATRAEKFLMSYICPGRTADQHPCSPERIDPTAAAAAAAAETSCQAEAHLINLPFIDTNTGLTYFYIIDCIGNGASATTGGTSGTTGTTVTPVNQQTFAYAQSLIATINSIIQSYKNILNLNSTQLQSLASQNVWVPSISSSVTVAVNAGLLNVRSSPNTSAAITRQLNANETFSAACYVTGENVEGYDKWWKTSDGNYVWAGGTTEQPSSTNSSLCGSVSTTLPLPILTSSASGIMHVGDNWNVVITGLNQFETIYATGGKKVNGVVPADKTPYTANDLGIYLKTGTHTADVIGDWQIVWTRADGTKLGTLVFSVQ